MHRVRAYTFDFCTYLYVAYTTLNKLFAVCFIYYRKLNIANIVWSSDRRRHVTPRSRSRPGYICGLTSGHLNTTVHYGVHTAAMGQMPHSTERILVSCKVVTDTDQWYLCISVYITILCYVLCNTCSIHAFQFRTTVTCIFSRLYVEGWLLLFFVSYAQKWGGTVPMLQKVGSTRYAYPRTPVSYAYAAKFFLNILFSVSTAKRTFEVQPLHTKWK